MDLKCPILGLVLDKSHKLFGSVVIVSYRDSSRLSLFACKRIGIVIYISLLEGHASDEELKLDDGSLISGNVPIGK
jgi:hypothetical protein